MYSERITNIFWVFDEKYDIPLQENHRFTAKKFSDLRSYLSSTKLKKAATIITPNMASDDDLTIAHCPQYISKIKHGKLSYSESRKLGLPWSPELAKRSFTAVNGTLLTANMAIKNGIACHLAGGTHHSHYNYGAGFCVFNDLAYTALSLIKMKTIKKILILDCDVHQGDGTANILQGNSAIFTCSIHAEKNFPYYKAQSDLDIGLRDNCSSAEYHSALTNALLNITESFVPELVLYVAGVDVHINDNLGRLNIDNNGLLNRDITVLKYFKERKIPVATVIGGGYSKDRIELAQRHSYIFQAAYHVWVVHN